MMISWMSLKMVKVKPHLSPRTPSSTKLSLVLLELLEMDLWLVTTSERESCNATHLMLNSSARNSTPEQAMQLITLRYPHLVQLRHLNAQIQQLRPSCSNNNRMRLRRVETEETGITRSKDSKDKQSMANKSI